MTTTTPTTLLKSPESRALFIADRASWLQGRLVLAAATCPF